MIPGSGTKANWLLRTLIVVSVGIHLVIFMHIAAMYHSRTPDYIEMSLKEISKPLSRSIPRPRHVHVDPSEPEHLQRIRMRKITIPPLRPIKLADVRRVTGYLPPERTSMPALPALDAPKIQKWVPAVNVDDGRKIADRNAGPRENRGIDDYDTPRSYLDMIRLRIESHKKYPHAAREKQIQGSVTVRFVITREGHVKMAKIIKSSGCSILDGAAVKAVKDAVPFPKPPAQLFSGDISVELVILFELT